MAAIPMFKEGDRVISAAGYTGRVMEVDGEFLTVMWDNGAFGNRINYAFVWHEKTTPHQAQQI